MSGMEEQEEVSMFPQSISESKSDVRSDRTPGTKGVCFSV